ncbi:hypothetical protein [Streptomyces silaceus]|uniref:hypothetical protein n=1 Tax=Streptomyces silaceus TaxID=545123 RepID=UPI0006EB4BDE|nr:hypothetical protein [Streptomyces silaceus]
MSDIDFYAEAALRKTFLGVPLGAAPEEWESRLGSDFLDDARKSRMRRDYGLIEIAFVRRAGSWESVSASLQIHRLARGLDEVVPRPLTDVHGEFSRHVPLDLFRAALQARGGELDEVTEPSAGGFRQFRETSTGTSLYVAGEPSQGAVEPGSLWSIIVSQDPAAP